MRFLLFVIFGLTSLTGYAYRITDFSRTPQSAIGVIEAGGNLCTAFLSGSQQITTNLHCLVKHQDSKEGQDFNERIQEARASLKQAWFYLHGNRLDKAFASPILDLDLHGGGVLKSSLLHGGDWIHLAIEKKLGVDKDGRNRFLNFSPLPIRRLIENRIRLTYTGVFREKQGEGDEAANYVITQSTCSASIPPPALLKKWCTKPDPENRPKTVECRFYSHDCDVVELDAEEGTAISSGAPLTIEQPGGTEVVGIQTADGIGVESKEAYHLATAIEPGDAFYSVATHADILRSYLSITELLVTQPELQRTPWTLSPTGSPTGSNRHWGSFEVLVKRWVFMSRNERLKRLFQIVPQLPPGAIEAAVAQMGGANLKGRAGSETVASRIFEISIWKSEIPVSQSTANLARAYDAQGNPNWSFALGSGDAAPKKK